MTDVNDIEIIFKAHYKQMYRLAITLLHDDDSARDIVHDVFDWLLHSRMPASLSRAYLLASVRNRCLSQIRSKGIHDRILNLYFSEMEEYDAEKWPDDETVAKVYQIIKEELTPPCRRVMELRFIDGLSFSKVAETLGVSENAVYKHVRNALVIIRKNLNQNG